MSQSGHHQFFSVGESSALEETMRMGDRFCASALARVPHVDPAIIRKHCTFPKPQPIPDKPEKEPASRGWGPNKEYHVFTAEETARALKLWGDGLHPADIAAELRRDRTTIISALRRAGIDTSVLRIRRSAAQAVVDALRSGSTVRDLAKQRRESSRRIVELAIAGGMSVAEIDNGKEAA